MRLTNKRGFWRPRRGLSFFEFAGCLVSMIGGVVLGSTYLGIDVQQMAVGVLEQAQVVAPGYFQQAKADSEGKVTELSGSGEGEGAEQPGLIESATTSSEAATESNSEAAQTTPTQPEPTQEERQAATRLYWNSLTECMLAEAQGRLSGEGNPEGWQLYDYLMQRKKGHEEALEKLNKLETFGVDQRLADHGQQVIAWHQSGAELFKKAISLLSDGPNAKLTGPFAQSWQSQATQLRMEEGLVIDRHQAIVNYLDREYPEEAPFKTAFAK